MQINFTIIIPHRNIPDLLERLIRSIPLRDDLEIIVVDDNSDSEIVDFEHFSCSGRMNFSVILNKENHGAGYARNCALPHAKGKWVLFADSDDFFNPGFNDFLDEYMNKEADIVYFNANSVDSETLEPSNRVEHLHVFIEEYNKKREYGEMLLRYLFTEPWCKMVKKQIIDDYQIRFEETIIRNDVRYSYLVGHYAKDIIVDNRQLYCVTTRQESVSRGRGYHASMDELQVYAGWKKFLIDNKVPLSLPKFDYRMYNFSRHLYKDMKLFREEYKILLLSGFSHMYIWYNILFNICKTIKFKFQALK